MKTRTIALVAVCLVAAGCAGTAGTGREQPPRPAPQQDRATVGYKIGVPYQIKGVWYYPQEDFEYSEVGYASWYGHPFHGRTTANGETYDMNAMTAAHKTLPLPSVVRVTNLENGRSLKLKVNDRGPFIDGRIIDVSRRAAQVLGFRTQGTARVRVDVISEESRVLAGLPSQDAPASQVGFAPASGTENTPLPVEYAKAVLPPDPSRRSPTSRALPAPLSLPTAAAASAPAKPRRPQPATLAELALSEPVPAGHSTPAASADQQPYIQAGAFSYATNAELVRSRLRAVGPVQISTVERDGHELFRVRVGPAVSDEEAGRLLVAVMEAGFPLSRIVYD